MRDTGPTTDKETYQLILNAYVSILEELDVEY